MDETASMSRFSDASHRVLRSLAKVILALLGLLAVAVAVKAVWVRRCCREIGSFESERTDILERRAYLAREILVEPDALIEKMPSAVGPQFQGEWALYSCSMFTAALVNIARLYPETRAESVGIADSLIRIVLSPALRQYDSVRWGKDAIMDLDGDDSHVSYLSHLAWMIGWYELLLSDIYDRDFAEEQYRRMKRLFIQEKPLAGMREYHDRDCTMGFDIDAGPIIMNLSPSGTAFALGPVTYFGDMALRTKILRTAEIAGSTIIRNGERHYLLADIVPVGEAIALAMRTALPSPN